MKASDIKCEDKLTTEGQSKYRHTPGPWSIDGPRIYDESKRLVATIGCFGEAVTEISNAKLISAAPDLLAALILMESEKSDYMTINALGDPSLQHTNKMARAAIIKVLGHVYAEKLQADLMPQKVSAAGAEFNAAEMALPLNALQKAGFSCNAALTAKLWSRFSKDQCATWMEIAEDTVERFVTWGASRFRL